MAELNTCPSVPGNTVATWAFSVPLKHTCRGIYFLHVPIPMEATQGTAQVFGAERFDKPRINLVPAENSIWMMVIVHILKLHSDNKAYFELKRMRLYGR